MKQLNFALVGCGRISDLHYRGYLLNPNATVYAICDVDITKAREKAVEWSIPKERVYSDFSRMLKNDQIDAVELLVPHQLHAPLTIEAAEAGKHISVQKPMANSLKECDEMIAAARKAGVKFRIFENFRFYPPYILAKKMINEGKLGHLISIHIKLGVGTGGWEVPSEAWIWRFDRDQCGGGPLCWDDGYHKWSIARWLIESEIESVYGRIDFTGIVEDDGEPKVDSPAKFIWKYKTPRTYGSMDATYMRNCEFPSKYYPADERVEITGDNGYIWINQCTANTVRNEAPLITYIGGELEEFFDIETDWQASFTNAVNHFIEAIIAGTKPEINPEEGKKIQQFAQAAHLSCKTHREEQPDKMV
ncbi:MAG: Gfo/Idh/MocA family protein [Promethearchaeota archaeon]